MRFYRLIGRLVSPLSIAGFFIYNRFFHVPRARVLIWNERQELLLVRNWNGKNQWALPGGGVETHEAPEQAAARELREEIGIDVPVERLEYVTTIIYQYEAIIYATTIDAAAIPLVPHNPWEITAIQWFPRTDLPADLSPLVPLALKKLSK